MEYTNSKKSTFCNECYIIQMLKQVLDEWCRTSTLTEITSDTSLYASS